MKIKVLSKPENFKLLKQIKLVRKKFILVCIERKTHLLLALWIKFLANNFRPRRKISFVVLKKRANLDQHFKSCCIFHKNWCQVCKRTVWENCE